MERRTRSFLLQGKASIHLCGGFNPAWLLPNNPAAPVTSLHLLVVLVPTSSGYLLFFAVAAREYTPKDVAVFLYFSW